MIIKVILKKKINYMSIKKEGISQIHKLTLQLNKLKKKNNKQTKPKTSRRKEIINTKVEIN